MSDLDFDLDNFDLETMDLNNTKFHSNSSMKSKSISDLFGKSSSGNSNIKQLHVDGMTRTSKSDSSIDMDDLGIDMLVNKNKFKKDDVNDYVPSQKPVSSPAPAPAPTSTPSQTSSFFNLFGSRNNQSSNSNNNSNNGNDDIEDINDIDKALENLDKDLHKGMDKIKHMSGPGIPNFNNSNSSNPSMYNNMSNGVNGGDMSDNYIPGESVNMSYEDIQKAKFDLLCKFERLRNKNVKLPKVFSMSSDYEEMKYEYERLLDQKKMDNSVKMQRRLLISFVNGVEFLNNRIDPFDINLNGWSETMHDGIDEYDEVFEELYEKYKGSGAMSPEMRLCFMVTGSAFMFHLQNSMIKSSIPNADVIFKNDPDLAQQFMKRAREMSGTEMFDGVMKNNRSGSGPPLYNDNVANGGSGGDGDIPDLDTLMRNL
jgi:hypothetical protein